jgi:hypothetical protein
MRTVAQAELEDDSAWFLAALGHSTDHPRWVQLRRHEQRQRLMLRRLAQLSEPELQCQHPLAGQSFDVTPLLLEGTVKAAIAASTAVALALGILARLAHLAESAQEVQALILRIAVLDDDKSPTWPGPAVLPVATTRWRWFTAPTRAP